MAPAGDISPGFVRRFWIALTASMLVLTLVTILTSPTGDWKTMVYGVEYQQYSDPGGWYLGSALAMTEPDTPAASFVGHPGQPLSLTLHAVARALHGADKLLGGSENFISYASGQLPTIIPVCLLVMGLLNVLACYCVYRITIEIGLSHSAALVAALAFATSWQALFYLARISVEPLATLFFLFAAISSLRCTGGLNAGKVRTALAWAAAAGASLVVLVYTKIHLAAPIAAASGLWLLFLPVRGGWRSTSFGTRFAVWVLFTVGAGTVFVAGLRFTDWHFFFDQWRHFVPGSNANTQASGTLLQNAREIFDKAIDSFRQIGVIVASFANKGQLSQSTLIEVGFYLLSTVGFFRAWAFRRVTRDKLIFLAIAVLTLAPIILFRRGFHYWTLLIALGAPFFGLAVTDLAAKCTAVTTVAKSRVVIAFAMTVIVHAGAFACYLDAKRFDARQYENIRAWLTALHDLEPGEKIGLLNNEGDGNQYYHVGLYFPYQHQYFLKKDSAVGAAFLARLVQVSPNTPPEELLARRIAFLLDSTGAPNDQRAWYIRWRDTRK